MRSFLPEAKHLTTQQPPTRLQQEDTDFCEVLWQTPLSTFATQVEAKSRAAEKEPQTLLCKDKTVLNKCVGSLREEGLRRGKKCRGVLCLTPVYFGKLFYGTENWWFNLIITLLVGVEQTDLGFAFCSGVSLRQIC